MTQSTAESPIQRRIAIDRTKTFGRIAVIGGALYVLFASWMYIDYGFRVERLPLVMLGVVFIIQGISQRRRASKLVAYLEQEFGLYAGVQHRDQS